MPLALRASAIPRSVVAPARRTSLITGITLAACRSAAGLQSQYGVLACGSEFGSAELHATSFGCRKSCFGPCGDQGSLLFRQSGEQVQDERVYVRAKLGDQERHPVGHQARDQSDGASGYRISGPGGEHLADASELKLALRREETGE